jgi:hypothetical protein
MLVTALAEKESHIIAGLREENIEVFSQNSPYTVYFENIYSANQDHREQNVLHKAASFTVSQMPAIEAKYFHLGPLLSDDITVDLIKMLAAKGKVSLDIQGYLRYVKDQKVLYKDWEDKKEALPYIHVLKANEFEMEVVAGTSDVIEGAKYLANLGGKRSDHYAGQQRVIDLQRQPFLPDPRLQTDRRRGCDGLRRYLHGRLPEPARAGRKRAGSGRVRGGDGDAENPVVGAVLRRCGDGTGSIAIRRMRPRNDCTSHFLKVVFE